MARKERSRPKAAFIALCLLISTAFATRTDAGPGGPYEGCGSLENTSGFPPCLVFTSDDGLRLVPENLAGFQPGARVFVSGTINPNVAFVCGAELVFPLQQNTIGPCFAGCGVLSDQGSPGCTYFVSVANGDHFLLEQDTGIPVGSEVFVSGAVDPTPVPCGPQMLPTITGNVIGACHQSLGRLISTFGCVKFVSTDGQRFDLQNTSHFGPGDYVEIACILTGEDLGACGHLLIQHNTTSPSFGGPGTMIADEACGLVFEADQGGFNSRYRLDATSIFLPGDRVVVTGRFPAMCPPDGDCDLPCIHDNTIDPLYAASGQFAGFEGECAVFLPDDGGSPLGVEHHGGQPVGTPIFVTGAVAPTSPVCVGGELPVLRHNTADPFLDTCGELQMGFECTPILISDEGVFWVENLEEFVLGDRVRVRGAVTSGCVDLCPYVCIRYNRIDVCVPGDLNRDGLVTVLDVPLFVDALLGEDQDAYRLSASDLNDDDAVNGMDIAPFVSAAFLVCPDCG